jgi:hypothetical protein
MAGMMLVLAGGCAAPTKSSPATKPAAPAGDPTDTDPCATRMHEICGVLLLYGNAHGDLPATLDALKKAPGAADVGEFVCPASNLPYVYYPEGVPVEPEPSRIVLYDPTPAHNGKRFAIVIQPPAGGGPPIARVILIPESKAKSLPATSAQ